MNRSMKVYVAQGGVDYEGSIVIGIFTSREKAQEACDQHKQRGSIPRIDNYYIDEYILDEARD